MYRNVKPYDRLSCSKRSERKAKLRKAVEEMSGSLPRDVKAVSVEITLDCGKTFRFSPLPEEDTVPENVPSSNINAQVLAIKDRFCVSDMCLHELHMLGQPIPSKSQLAMEKAMLNITFTRPLRVASYYLLLF